MDRRTILKWTGSMAGLPLAQANAFQSKSATAPASEHKDPIDIGHVPQFFFDYTLVEMSQDLTQVMHHPVRYRDNPVIKRDRAWEGVPYFVLSSGDRKSVV